VTLSQLGFDDDRKIGAMVQDCFAELEKVNYSFSSKLLEELQSLDWSRTHFKKLYYHVLKKFDPSKTIEEQRVDYKGNGRYYEQLYTFSGKQFLLTSQWYKDAKEQFVNWYNGLN
jgi:hypothetical protein